MCSVIPSFMVYVFSVVIKIIYIVFTKIQIITFLCHTYDMYIHSMLLITLMSRILVIVFPSCSEFRSKCPRLKYPRSNGSNFGNIGKNVLGQNVPKTRSA